MNELFFEVQSIYVNFFYFIDFNCCNSLSLRTLAVNSIFLIFRASCFAVILGGGGSTEAPLLYVDLHLGSVKAQE